jgi:transcriptional regulator with XRE-family HTH domain
MLRLRIRELSEARGLSLAEFQREAKLPVSVARRAWHSTADGLPSGRPLQSVYLDLLEKLADFFEVPVGDLFERLPDK